MSASRRFYLYLVLLVSLVILSVGVGQLLALLFDGIFKASARQVGGERFDVQQLSLGIAMIVVAAPLWLLLWRWVQNRVKQNTEEIGAGVRKLYLNLVLAVAFLTALGTVSEVLRWLLAGAPAARVSTGAMATSVVTAVIWAWHCRISEHEGHPTPVARTLRRWYVYSVSAFGLVWLSVGVVNLFSSLTLTVWGGQGAVISAPVWNDSVRSSLAMAVMGALTWLLHWSRLGRGDYSSVLRQVYFYVLAITGGAVAALVAATVTLHRLLVWVLGGVTVDMARHFQVLSWTIPLAIVGTVVWGYHQRLVQEERQQSPAQSQSAQRVHLYLMSFIALGALVAGLLLLLGVILTAVIGAATPPVTTARGAWQDILGWCLALLIVGTPLWMYYWGKVLRRVEAGGIAEWRSSARRFYLYSLVAIGAIALAGSLVSLLYQIINSALLGEFDIDVLRNSRWSLQIVLVAAPLLWYHWRAVRADQKRGAETAPRKGVTLLTPSRDGVLASRIGESLGHRVHVLYRLASEGEAEPAPSDEDLARLKAEIESAPGELVLVAVVDGRLVVLPYVEK